MKNHSPQRKVAPITCSCATQSAGYYANFSRTDPLAFQARLVSCVVIGLYYCRCEATLLMSEDLCNMFLFPPNPEVLSAKNAADLTDFFPVPFHRFTPSPILQVRLVFLVLSIVGAIPAIRPGDARWCPPSRLGTRGFSNSFVYVA